MMEKAIAHLKAHGIESFELMNILTIPVDSPEEIEPMVSKLTKLLKECGYNKSWRVDPYYYEKHSSLTADMFEEVKDGE